MLRNSILLAGAAILMIQQSQSADQAGKKQSAAQATSATLDQMIAAHKSPRELAEYVFDTHGCKSCHNVGQDGKLGFTPRGEQAARGYEGCISLLTAMKSISEVPEDKRSAEQRHEAADFQQFGCTACHTVSRGDMGLTQLGAKLTRVHLGCVDIENLISSRQ